MKNKRWAIVGAILVVLFLFQFVWPTPYRYHTAGQYLVREHRVTGEMAVFGATPDGRFAWTEKVAR